MQCNICTQMYTICINAMYVYWYIYIYIYISRRPHHIPGPHLIRGPHLVFGPHHMAVDD